MYLFLRSLLDPVTLTFFALGICLALAWWKHPDARKALRWLTLAFACGWVVLTGAFAYVAAGLLEWHYPPVLELPEETQAIVLFSGGARGANDFLPQVWPAEDTLRRCRLAAQLYHSRADDSQRCPIIACGGKVERHPESETLATVIQRELVRMGVDADDIILEDQSSDTYYNAVHASEILQERGWSRVVLVTDGMHLMRSELCLKQQGIDPTPAGAYYAASRFQGSVLDFLPRTGSANTVNYALHEAVGMLWYKLRGRI